MWVIGDGANDQDASFTPWCMVYVALREEHKENTSPFLTFCFLFFVPRWSIGCLYVLPCVACRSKHPPYAIAHRGADVPLEISTAVSCTPHGNVR